MRRRNTAFRRGECGTLLSICRFRLLLESLVHEPCQLDIHFELVCPDPSQIVFLGKDHRTFHAGAVNTIGSHVREPVTGHLRVLRNYLTCERAGDGKLIGRDRANMVVHAPREEVNASGGPREPAPTARQPPASFL